MLVRSISPVQALVGPGTLYPVLGKHTFAIFTWHKWLHAILEDPTGEGEDKHLPYWPFDSKADIRLPSFKKLLLMVVFRDSFVKRFVHICAPYK